MTINRDLAQSFATAHESDQLLVLPTVWDVWSAQLTAAAGFSGLTIGSHPVANSIGDKDGEHMNFEHYLDITRAIARAVDVPVSVDVESGYGLDPTELAKAVIETGAVGLNIEDTVHTENDRVRSLEEHRDYIAAVREEADRQDIALVINGRTDALKHGTAQFTDPEAEAIARIQALVEAGARSVYPVGATNHDLISRLVAAVDVPLNVTVDPLAQTPGTLDELRGIGVRRATWGPKWQAGLEKVLADSLSDWL